MKGNFTQISNALFEISNLSINARYLYGVLRKSCYQKTFCFLSQYSLSLVMNMSTKQLRKYLKELRDAGLVSWKRSGYNRPNIYIVAREVEISDDGNSTSPLLRSVGPLQMEPTLPPNNTKRIIKDNNISRPEKLRLLKEESGLITRNGMAKFKIGS